MNFNYLKLITKSSLLVVLAFTSCNNDDDNTNNSLETSKTDFVSTYANIAATNYNDSYTSALEMQVKIDAFLETPTETALEEAKEAWLYARDFYGQTEAFREANGPIDNEDLLASEGQINAWPLDEGYIDYVFDSQNHSYVNNGLIGDDSFEITEANLISNNETPNDDSISVGWHAIEFLLWGQDLNYNSETHQADNYAESGNRPFTDYTTADFATRRSTYLKVVTNLLVNDLKDLSDTWATGGSYRVTFSALDTDVALTNILNGVGFISNGEVALERLDPAIDEGQENEHSCFSDNTNQDMWANATGLNNVITGSYTAKDKSLVSGTSLIDLVAEYDTEISVNLQAKAADVITKLNALLALNKNFDEIISEETLGSNGPAGQLSSALKTQGTAVADAATELGISITIN
ncbi:putative iron-regulated protein [Wenyingzhuangia heitensis]|uniref:Iron-regulated protein n=1 Tax=Wenyingzhuangia heitensis TaxID=1487859 RepID=A0ABX0UCA8_9FLAO|nr:imelysin family protein [Wenyingzhuangia heitensis]NIJ46373.1 putative iron-regulated protein [Wenyingzhuangia heitensis]